MVATYYIKLFHTGGGRQTQRYFNVSSPFSCRDNNDKCRCECENPKEYNAFGKDYIWNPTTCSCENVEYFTSAIVDSVITCDEIIIVAGSVSKNGLANFHKMNCYILHTVLLVIILLLIIAIICYHYAKLKNILSS